MILVLLGTQNNSFHRLLEEVQKNIEKKKIKEDVIVQKGYTKFESQDMKMYTEIPIDELNKLIDQADLIITHGGVGSIISSIKKGKKVIAVPRLEKYKEHVNDHQKDIVETFNQSGYIIGIENVEQLGEALDKVESFIPKKYISDNSKMLKIIEDFIG